MDSKNKRKKGYYLKAAKKHQKRHAHSLEPGLKGFLLTCNNREKEAVREAYNILNEYADDMLGPEQDTKANDQKGHGDEASDGSDDDISAALEKEISSIKAKPSSERRFQVVDSGANNCLFIRTTIDKPDQLAHKILNELHQSRSSKSRYIMRLVPVIGTCRTDYEKIEKLASDVLPGYFGTGEARSYCVLSKVRNNSSFGKQDLVHILRRVIQELNPLHSFDSKDPDYIISMDIIKSVCCMSVMSDFFKFRKYNMQEVVKPDEEMAKTGESCNSEVTEEAGVIGNSNIPIHDIDSAVDNGTETTNAENVTSEVPSPESQMPDLESTAACTLHSGSGAVQCVEHVGTGNAEEAEECDIRTLKAQELEPKPTPPDTEETHT